MTLILKGAHLLEKWAKDRVKKHKDAMLKTIYATAYDTYKQMQSDLEDGALELQALSKMRSGGGVNKSTPPLAGTSKGITYKVWKEKLKFKVGFGAVQGSGKWQRKIISKSARPAGYRWKYSPYKIRRLHEIGVHLRKETIKRGAKVPHRDPVNKFKSKWRDEIYDTLVNYYKRALKGKYVQSKGGLK